MSIAARDELIEKLETLQPVSFALQHLRREIENRDKPLTVTYADLGAFQAAFGYEHEINKEAFDGDELDEQAYRDGHLEVEQAKRAFSNAMEAGFITTRDVTRSRG